MITRAAYRDFARRYLRTSIRDSAASRMTLERLARRHQRLPIILNLVMCITDEYNSS